MSKDIFQTTARNLFGVMETAKASSMSYRIPLYQRTYDWDTSNIDDLVAKCLAGFRNLSEGNEERAPSYTFLGTIIVVTDRKEPEFEGTSYEVVDGQQRLTTLNLIICALINELEKAKGSVSVGKNVNSACKEWIESQISEMAKCLLKCIRGYRNTGLNKKSYFPRIVRGEDNHSTMPAQYNSELSSFIKKVYECCHKSKSIDELFPGNEDGGKKSRLHENYEYVKDTIARLSSPTLYTDLNQLEMVDSSSFKKEFMIEGFIDIKEKYDSRIDKADMISSCIKDERASSVLRTLLFSSYIMTHVMLVITEAKNHNYAFDMFDSLNTTGEPLTALDTLKPLVVELEETRTTGGYKESASKEYLDNVDKFLENNYSKADDKIKGFIISLSVYWGSKKQLVSKGLKEQRQYLRNISKILRNNPDDHEDFIKSISDFSDFMNTYGIKEKIGSLDSEEEADIKTCLQFILEMQTILCLPILARYYIANNIPEFVSATKALAAFLAIRRAYTGGTEGIDSVFRNLMSQEPKTNSRKPLGTGLINTHEIWPADDLKKELIYYLQKKSINIEDNTNWIEKASNEPLATKAKALCKFFILAAANRSVVTDDGLWQVGSIEPHTIYLNYESLIKPIYNTLEHIAPKTPSKESTWAEDIYDSEAIHTLGNLTLLPELDNIRASNRNWNSKQEYFAALASKTKDELASFQKKYNLTEKEVARISKQGTIELLDFAKKINNWDLETIKKRSRNIASRAWDELIIWL